jgi:hypothetical protein
VLGRKLALRTGTCDFDCKAGLLLSKLQLLVIWTASRQALPRAVKRPCASRMRAGLAHQTKGVRRFQTQAEKQISSASASLGVGMTTIKYC